MKYFIDTEFIEGFRKPLFGKKRHFIDLISIGIYREDGKFLYLISNEYNFNDADEWVKDNVIMPAYKSYVSGDARNRLDTTNFHKYLGYSNEEIKNKLLDFFGCWRDVLFYRAPEDIEVYGYYADYDWVLFCSLFGRMIDLPKGFPMYCKDLKQILDETLLNYKKTVKYFDTERRMAFSGNFEELAFADSIKEKEIDLSKYDLKYKLDFMKKYHSGYPKQENEHNALDDAKWNFNLFQFIQGLK